MAISRVIDNQHSPGDIIGGAFLGTVMALTFLARALAGHSRFVPPPRGSQEPLLNNGQAHAMSNP